MLSNRLGKGISGNCLDILIVFKYAREVLFDETNDIHYLPWLYTQDSEEEIWQDEQSWYKSNPGLGVVKKWKSLRGEIEKSKTSKSKRMHTLCKDFNIKQKIIEFFNNLNYNEFDYTNELFDILEKDEDKYLSSPLIMDYLLAKPARYSSTPSRDKFDNSKDMILSSFDLLSNNQKFIYNFYVAIDILILSDNKQLGKILLEEALGYKESGHCYFWLSYSYRIENNPIKAYESIQKALNLYVAEGNIIFLYYFKP